MDAFHANLLLLHCQRLAVAPQPFDCAIRVRVAEQSEHLLFAHSATLAAKCAHFRTQLEHSAPVPAHSLLTADNEPALLSLIGLAAQPQLFELRVDLSMLDGALDAFRTFIAHLYGDNGPMAAANPDSVVFLAKLFAVPELEMAARQALLGRLLEQSGSAAHQLTPGAAAVTLASTMLPSPGGSSSSASSASSSSATTTASSANSENTLPLYAAYLRLQSLIQQQHSVGAVAPSFGHSGALVGQGVPMEQKVSAEQMALAGSASSSFSGGTASASFSPTGAAPTGGGELLVPSNDKEGWCRNKKYIQIVKKGYRCLVCNKVYGRYNSVSYHVTIYHRNPPIRCEEEGCQFTTREARYIHFHKYYRHQIALPESIDLASRKCPLVGCKHVSKSPAMLDKHIHRHVADCLKEGVYACAMPEQGAAGGQCMFRATTHEAMYEHLLGTHSTGGGSRSADAKMEHCGEEEDSGERRKSSCAPRLVSSASAPTTPPTPNARFQCDQCQFKGRTLVALEQHKVQKHARGRTATVPSSSGALALMQQQQTGEAGSPFGGLLFGNVLAGGFGSLPESPLSPSAGGGGLFPPAPPMLLLNPALVADQQQLLAQLLAAQKLASALLSPPANGEPKLF